MKLEREPEVLQDAPAEVTATATNPFEGAQHNSRVGRNPMARAIFESTFRTVLALVDTALLLLSYWVALWGYEHWLGKALPPLMREPWAVAAAAAGATAVAAPPQLELAL